MTQPALAKRLQVTKSVISAYETGLRMPSYETLLMISKVFSVSTDYLLGNDIGKGNTIDVSGLSDKQIDEIVKRDEAPDELGKFLDSIPVT